MPSLEGVHAAVVVALLAAESNDVEYGKTAVFLKDALEMKKITYTRIAVWLWQAMAKYCSLRTKMIRRLNQKTLLGIDSNIGINSNILKYNYRCKILVNCRNGFYKFAQTSKKSKARKTWRTLVSVRKT